MEFINMMLDPDLTVREHFWELWGQLTPQERQTYDIIAIRASVEAESDADRLEAARLHELAIARLAESRGD